LPYVLSGEFLVPRAVGPVKAARREAVASGQP